MKRLMFAAIIGLFTLGLGSSRFAQKKVEYLQFKPMHERSAVKAQPVRVKPSDKIGKPTITWGGDVEDVYARDYEIFAKHGLNIELNCENRFLTQVEAVIRGETPYLRGTHGMINGAGELLKRNGIGMILIHKKTYSTGGDILVVRPGKTLRNIRKVALQLDGPHMDYASRLFKDAGRNLKDIQFMYLEHLSDDYQDAGTVARDPKSAFLADPTLDACFVIVPDALTLTSGGEVGKGGSDSVEGATMLVSTKTARTVISDGDYVRKDWFDASPENRNHAFQLAHALLQAEEDLRDLLKNKEQEQAKYRQLMSSSAALLWGSAAAGAEIEAMLGACTFDGYNGNVTFFTGKGTTRNFETLTQEIQASFIEMGVLPGRVEMHKADFDLAKLAEGLRYATDVVTTAPRLDPKKVAAAVAGRGEAAASEWGSDALFEIEIHFAPHQTQFPEAKYAGPFNEAMKMAQTYSGALITVDGHSNKYGKNSIQSAIDEGKPQPLISQRIQVAKNLSMERANKVREDFIAYCKNHGFVIAASRFYAVGLGISQQKFDPPVSQEQWKANFRAVFRIMPVEAESSEWEAPVAAR